MAETEQKKTVSSAKAKAVDFWHHRSRATRLELLLLVVVFLFFEFIVPTILGSQYSKRFFEKHLSDALRYPVTFDRINTNLFGRPALWVGGMNIQDHEGHPFFRGDEVKMELSPWALLRGHIVLNLIRLVDGDFLAARLPDGRWNIADLVSAGNDPDRAIDLEKTAVEMRNMVATIQDQALPLPLVQHIRLRDFSISTLDIRRKTRLQIDAIDDDHPESSLEVKGNFAVFVPDDLSTLSGNLDLTLKHFNLQILNSYLGSTKSQVKGFEGFYDIQLKMEGQGSSPISIILRSKADQLRVAIDATSSGASGSAGSTHPSPEALNRGRKWIDFKTASLEGLVGLSTDEIRFTKLNGELASTHFEMDGRVYNLHTRMPRLETSVSTSEFEIADPLRSLIDAELDEFGRRIFAGLTGTARAQLIWTGRLDDPTFDWRAELKKSQYRNDQYEFQLKDIVSVMRSNGKKTQIDSLGAQFFNSPLQVSGWVDEKDRVNMKLSLPAVPLGQIYPFMKRLRSQGYLASMPWLDRVPSVSGRGHAELLVTGDLDHPEAAGTLSIAGTRIQLAGLSFPIENVEGRVVLKDRVVCAHQFYHRAVCADPISGSLGDSPFELEAVLDPKEFSLLALHFRSPSMNLHRYDELTSSRWIDRVDLPIVGQIKGADGVADIQLDYPSGGVRRAAPISRPVAQVSGLDGEADGEDDPVLLNESGRLPEFSLQMRNLRNGGAVLSNVALPLKGFSGGLIYSGDRLRFRHLEGSLGDSSLSLDGGIEQLNELGERWDLKAQMSAAFPQMSLLLPAAWKNQITAEGQFPVTISFLGERNDQLEVRAEVNFPESAQLRLARSFEKPVGTSSHLSLDGVWKNQAFDINEGNLTLGELPLAVHGTLDFSETLGVEMALTAAMDQFAPVTTLLKFVKLPATSLSVRGGSASGSVTLSGNPSDPEVSSTLRLADVSVDGMPWGPTSLTGDLTVGTGGVSARDFLAIVNKLPMRVTGTLNLNGPQPALSAEVDNLNLDALVTTLARMSPGAEAPPSGAAGKMMTIDVRASSGVFFHQPIKKFVAHGTWDAAVIQLDPMEVTAGGSTSNAAITWKSRTNEEHLKFESRDVPMGAFLDEILDIQIPVEGKLTVQGDLTSRNTDPQNLLASLVGNAHFDASQGTLHYAGLPQRLLSMATLVHEGLFGFNLGRIFQTIDPPQFKQFKSWSADVTFSPDGSARLERSDFKSELFDLTATGTVNTKTEDMVINVKGSLPEIPHSSNFLAQIFGQISIRGIYRNVADFTLLITGQRKKIKPRRYNFEFKLTGNLEGIKSIEDFRFVK
ncbi:MAG: AsmA family protein [Acidobacteriia bacterium]|nr:AsmA family protein [Terriglobia bacterium]